MSQEESRVIKKPRLGTSQNSLSSPPSVSATHRFLQTPELFCFLLDHLDFDKLDMVTLSTVSKRMRINVLPRLMRSINLPLDRAFDLQEVLRAYPGLVDHIRFVRVWDPVANQYARNSSVEKVYRNRDAPHVHRDTWNRFGDLLLMVQQRQVMQMPFLDLSIGQINKSLYNQLKRAPQLLERLSALRVVGDFDASRYPGVADAQAAFHNHGEAMSEELSDILHLTLDTQDSVGSSALQVFHFEGLNLHAAARDSVLPALRPRLLKRLALRIRDLSIKIHEAASSDMSTFATLLAVQWPNLRRFQLRLQSNLPSQPETFKSSILAFLNRHSSLVDVDIHIDEDAQMAVPFDWAAFSLPELRSCAFSGLWPSDAAMLTFARQHGSIRDLTVTSGREAGTFASPEIVNSLSTLRRLDGGADPVSAFLRAGAPLNLVQIHSKDSVHYVPRSPLSSITCLNILDVVDEDFDSSHTVLMLERLLRENRFPNLVELAVRYKGGRREKFYDTSAESAQALAAILEALSNQRVTVLRALWVGCDTAQALPSDEVLAKVVKEFPPALRYVSWYLPFSNTTQHFRVLPPSKLFYPPSSSCALVILSPQQRRRLQRLPSSFRPMVAQTTGVWKGLDGEPDDQLIFDHTGDSPRLKYV
ncbi:unnamed protein product [Tilletia laevis]|nr:unnamed protein product [Tilletia laevis]CAD6918573.1 unnamed protein product [Tilletia laevis]CAD6933919.1 unnamed protein product [Tilletia controversa]CAD6982779.1 unnamed protein product [Tilletia controversa]